MSKGTATTRVGTRVTRRMSHVITGNNGHPRLTTVLMKRSKKDRACIHGGILTYRTYKFGSALLHFRSAVARTRLLSGIRVLGHSRSMSNFVMRLPLPHRVSRRGMVRTVSCHGSMSNFRPVGIKHVTVNLPYCVSTAPGNVLRLLGHCRVRADNGGYIVLKHDGVMNGPVTRLVVRGRCNSTAMAIYRDHDHSLGGRYHRTSVVVTTVNRPSFIATSVMGSKTAVVSMNAAHIPSTDGGDNFHLGKSIGFSRMTPGYTFVAPIPNNINPVAVYVLVGGALSTKGGRFCRWNEGGGWGGQYRDLRFRFGYMPLRHFEGRVQQSFGGGLGCNSCDSIN